MSLLTAPLLISNVAFDDVKVTLCIYDTDELLPSHKMLICLN